MSDRILTEGEIEKLIGALSQERYLARHCTYQEAKILTEAQDAKTYQATLQALAGKTEEEKMLETTKEICKHCGKEYEDTHIVPRAPYAPYYCEKCMNELNEICGGSWVSAVYQSVKHSNRSPMEEV